MVTGKPRTTKEKRLTVGRNQAIVFPDEPEPVVVRIRYPREAKPKVINRRKPAT
jgi:hypothetical protein